MKKADIQKGIDKIKFYAHIVKEEIQKKKLVNDTDYATNEFINGFNLMYVLLSTMGILPTTDTNLTIKEFTDLRIKLVDME